MIAKIHHRQNKRKMSDTEANLIHHFQNLKTVASEKTNMTEHSESQQIEDDENAISCRSQSQNGLTSEDEKSFESGLQLQFAGDWELTEKSDKKFEQASCNLIHHFQNQKTVVSENTNLIEDSGSQHLEDERNVISCRFQSQNELTNEDEKSFEC